MTATLVSLAVCLSMAQAPPIGQNLLEDPGFERYRYDADLGWYVPTEDAAWNEYGFGIGSVRMDASEWTAPEGMAAERPLGFSPGGGGFTGESLPNNRGVLYMWQDVADSTKLPRQRDYEAWVWLGGAGNDDDGIEHVDRKEERGGWAIYWYNHTDTASWSFDNAMEVHQVQREYHGPPNSFVRIYGSGLIPLGSVGFRMVVFAHSWVGNPPPVGVDTRVALDNAHYGIISHVLNPNGGFELDTEVGDFVNWIHPDPWFGIPDTLAPGNQLMPAEYEFLLPFKPRARSYGHDVYSMGWHSGGFSFGKEIDIASYGPGATFSLTFYWYQTMRNQHLAHHLRRPMARVRVGVEFLDAASTVLETIRETVVWPYASNPNNTSPYDNNDNTAYNHYIPLAPPPGTQRIGMHLRCETNAQEWVNNALFMHTIDDIHLRVVSAPTHTPTPTPTPTAVGVMTLY